MRTVFQTLAVVAAVAAAVADPAPTSTNWTVISKNVASFAFGVAFINETYGYLPGDQNGKGAEVLISSDGGKTWNYNQGTGFALAFTDVRAINETVVVSGLVSGEHHSSDYGETFTRSKGGGLSQCVRLVGTREHPYGYGIAGQIDSLSKQGVAISLDGGVTFKDSDCTNLEDDAEARYAAFPSESSWYLASGKFPTGDSDTTSSPSDADRTVIRGRLGMRGGKLDVSFPEAGPTNDDPTASWWAQLDRTADGGNSWTNQFTDDRFYFNGIACHSTEECCAVGESDAGTMPGSRIWCTQDGGSTWNQTLFNAGPQNSLLDIAAVGEDTYWAVGGSLVSQFDITGQIWLSQDKGATWSLADTIHANYVTSIDCIGIDTCWATTANELKLASVAAIVH